MNDRYTMSYGTLVYGPSKRVVVEIDQGIVDCYRSLIPKYKCVKPQKHKSHITVVRKYEYDSLDMDNWEYLDGATVPFVYDSKIQYTTPYYFLRTYSKAIGIIRRKLGLPTFREGYDGFYHITIGNTK